MAPVLFLAVLCQAKPAGVEGPWWAGWFFFPGVRGSCKRPCPNQDEQAKAKRKWLRPFLPKLAHLTHIIFINRVYILKENFMGEAGGVAGECFQAFKEAFKRGDVNR